MQHYQFHIGDYAQATAHLSPLEDLAYRRLIDLYYDTEGHIPYEATQAARRVRLDAVTVSQVLQEFFVDTGSSWQHARCDKEIAQVYEKSYKARESGLRSGEVRRAKAEQSNSNRSTNIERTLNERSTNAELPVTRNPLPVTQDPEPKEAAPVLTLLVSPNASTESKGSNPLQPAAPIARKKKVADAESIELQAVCRETWGAYSESYAGRYGTPPIRNAKISGQVKQFCQRVPALEAPHIAAFYVRHNASFYVGKGHAVGPLLADAEKLRTEWATNQTITQTQAQQADKTQANGNVWGKVIAGIEERERNAAVN